jgi:Fic family protein
MFEPQYQLNTALLNNIVRVKNLIQELNDQKFSDIVLAKFEKESYAISAHASTSIEGNPLPLTDVRRILKSTPVHIRDTEKEIINYNTALHYLDIRLSDQKSITKDFICTIQSMVTKDLIDVLNCGKLRTEQVVVNDPRKRQIAYIPPNAHDVPDLMKDLEVFLNKNNTQIDPLLLSGIFHKQFVIIHPFMDGNGRTARLVTKYMLAGMGLDTFRLFSFENYYNQNVTKYFSSVGVIGDYYKIEKNIDFTDWLVYFTDGIIDELLRVQKLLYNSIEPIVKKEHEKIIIEYIQKNGSISKSEYEKITDRAQSTQILDFKRLVEKRVIKKMGRGKATYYILK